MLSNNEYEELLLIIKDSFDKLEQNLDERLAAIHTRLVCNEVWLKQITKLLENMKK